jgi:major membrane immunogen (membrane-anchored lipoprotein)
MRKVLLTLMILLAAFGASAQGENEREALLDRADQLKAEGWMKSAPQAAAEPEKERGMYEDGIYFAMEDGFSSSGWKYVVTLEVDNGYIVSADWNGVHVKAGRDKKTVSKAGDYNMVAYGGAISEWDVQAEAAEAHLLKTQDPTAVTYTSDAGHTDDIAGVTIHVVEFFSLAEKALAAGPVGRGPYADGHYFAEEEGYSGSGWKYFVDMTVINGYIAAVNWNGANVSAGPLKKAVSKAGDYGMVARGGAIAEWDVQAEAAEAYLLKTQDPSAVNYTSEDGHTDDIAGVTIHVVEFFSLVEQALAAGPQEIGPYADGFYHAEEAQFGSSGWKYVVDLTVNNGRIVTASWNGAHKDSGTDKKTRSASGEYGMVARGGAIAEWDVQAKAAEAYLLETQDPSAVNYTSEDGHTDDIAGVTIHVVEFFSLVEQALAAGPQPYGPYKNGYYHAEGEASSNGWRPAVDITVIGGHIAAVKFDDLNPDGESKAVQAAEGVYGMVERGGAQASWDVQAKRAADYLLQQQDPTASVDAIAGVSITISDHFRLAAELLGK